MPTICLLDLVDPTVSADWHSFLVWLTQHGMDDHDEIWRRFVSQTPEIERHQNAMELFRNGAPFISGQGRVYVAAGAALLMGEVEWSPKARGLCNELGERLKEVLDELDASPGPPSDSPNIVAALLPSLDDRSIISSWNQVLWNAMLLLISGAGPALATLRHIGGLCNLALEQSGRLLCDRLRESEARDMPYMRIARVRYMDALTRYLDAARQLEREVGEVLFSQPPALGIDGLPP